MTDEWRAYSAALRNSEFYTHDTIYHSFHFVDPNNFEIHSQNVECLWSHAKRALRRKNGINKESEFEHLILLCGKNRLRKTSVLTKL